MGSGEIMSTKISQEQEEKNTIRHDVNYMWGGVTSQGSRENAGPQELRRKSRSPLMTV